MTMQRVMRIIRPSVALAALALALIALGLMLTGAARAASPTPLESLKTDVQRAAQTRDAIVQFGDPVTVAAGDTVGTVVSFGGDVTVGGTVRDTVVIFGGDLRLLPTAVVGADMRPGDASVVLLGGGVLTREPGAEVSGEIQRFDGKAWRQSLSWATQHTVIRPWWGFTLMGWVVQTAFYLVLALVAAALMPRQMRAVQRHIRLKPAGSLGWGALIFFIAGPALLVILVISIVGLLVVLPYVLFVLLAYFFVTTAVAAFVAQRVLAGSGQNDSLMLATTLGVIGTTIVSRIPVLGPLVVMAMILFGTGAATLAIVEWRQARKSAGAPAPAGTPIAAAAGGAPVIAPFLSGAPATATTIAVAEAPTAAETPTEESAAATEAAAANEPPAAEESAAEAAPAPPADR